MKRMIVSSTLDDHYLDGKLVTRYIFDDGYQKFSGQTEEEAERKFVDWINNNTNYRGLNMYAKHRGYNKYYQTSDGSYYMYNGMTLYEVDENGRILRTVK